MQNLRRFLLPMLHSEINYAEKRLLQFVGAGFGAGLCFGTAVCVTDHYSNVLEDTCAITVSAGIGTFGGAATWLLWPAPVPIFAATAFAQLSKKKIEVRFK